MVDQTEQQIAALDVDAFIEAIASGSGVPAGKVKAVLKALATVSGGALSEGKAVRIPGLGMLRVRDVPGGGVGKAAAGPLKRLILQPTPGLKRQALGA